MSSGHIKDWHAHVYFDPASRDAAWALRKRIERTFDIDMGRFHEKPVGPHPRFSYQVHFRNDQLASLISWLTLNRGELTVFVHPNTGEALEDHRDRAVWLGQQMPLKLDALKS
ncbi:DOPA 4,5-dioxygenase family protein [Reyranella sp.]|uniref:DOPA 4,5-dioxygenase family protein n=1 Tax=Reyranella sp. TaxID=1929291 RepID=UPI002F92A658